MTWQDIAYLLIGLLIGVVFHEYMHGRIAEWLGDTTARRSGRITLNPVPHIDIFGTVILPLALALFLMVTGHGMIFGYAKPVPINPFLLKKPRRDMALVALGGPATNFTLACLFTIIAFIIRVSFHLKFFMDLSDNLICPKGQIWAGIFTLLLSIAVINTVLGFINLIPIPPLDGSHILEYFLPPRAQQAYESLARYGFVLAFVCIIVLWPIFAIWMNPIFNMMQKAVLGPLTQSIL